MTPSLIPKLSRLISLKRKSNLVGFSFTFISLETASSHRVKSGEILENNLHVKKQTQHCINYQTSLTINKPHFIFSEKHFSFTRQSNPLMVHKCTKQVEKHFDCFLGLWSWIIKTLNIPHCIIIYGMFNHTSLCLKRTCPIQMSNRKKIIYINTCTQSHKKWPLTLNSPCMLHDAHKRLKSHLIGCLHYGCFLPAVNNTDICAVSTGTVRRRCCEMESMLPEVTKSVFCISLTTTSLA